MPIIHQHHKHIPPPTALLFGPNFLPPSCPPPSILSPSLILPHLIPFPSAFYCHKTNPQPTGQPNHNKTNSHYPRRNKMVATLRTMSSTQMTSSSSSRVPIPLLFLLFSLAPSMAESFRTQLFPQLVIQQKGINDDAQSKSSTPSKCQKDYLEAMVHRCRVGDRVCFADDLELEDVQELAGYISEMCCLLRCQPKTLERLCCRSQQGKCRKAKCLSVQELGLMIEGDG